ncbi:MAG: hypothetical protein AAFZ80_12125 [Cyanobacteria bacterium P01_A01_bin.105]
MAAAAPVSIASSPMDELDCRLWDFAGVDGLQTAIALFSAAVSHLAPFQSRSVALNSAPATLLRLCENNFRVALPENVDFRAALTPLPSNVWVKPCQTANLVLSPAVGLERLAQIAVTKPRFRLTPLPLNQAVPARINGTAILVWHQLWQEQPRLLIQTARVDIESVQAAFDREA